MLTGLLGNGLAILLAGLAYIIARHRRHFSKWPKVVEGLITAAVILMLLAGEMARSTGLGGWVISMLSSIESAVGKDGGVIIALALTVGCIIAGAAILKTASERAMILAFWLPFGFAMYRTGIFHSIDMYLQPLAADVAERIANALGVS
jgi:hypothetical protein